MRIPHLLMFACLSAISRVHSAALEENEDAAAAGRRHVVVLDTSLEPTPNIHDVLSSISLHADHPNVAHIYNTSAFQGFSARLSPSDISTLSLNPNILHLEKTSMLKRQSTTAIVSSGHPWGLQRISDPNMANPNIHTVRNGELELSDYATSDWFNYTRIHDANTESQGLGVDIYVIDTGIWTAHPAFGGRATMKYAVDGDMRPRFTHGTQVTSVAAGSVVGVAPLANVIGVRVMRGDDPSASTDDVMAGIQYVLRAHESRKRRHGAKGSILHMSMGFAGTNEIGKWFMRLLDKAMDAGIHVVLGAGNEAGDSCDFTPGRLGGKGGRAITVGALTPANGVSFFSNRGACVDVYAPGEHVVSATMPGKQDQNITPAWFMGGLYVPAHGTSIASPFVTGLVACYLGRSDGGGGRMGDVEGVKRWVGTMAQRRGLRIAETWGFEAEEKRAIAVDDVSGAAAVQERNIVLPFILILGAILLEVFNVV